MRVNQKQLAQLLGLNQSTVSRALCGSPEVSAVVRQRVLSSAAKLGYHPDYIASSMAAGQTKAISVLRAGSMAFSDVHSQWVGHLQRATRLAGYRFRLDHIDDSARVAAERSADAFVFLGEYVDGEVNAGACPVVYTDCEPVPGRTTISTGNARGTALAVRHLIGLGHRELAFAGLVESSGICKARHGGFIEAVSDWSLPASAARVIHMSSWCDEPGDIWRYEAELLKALNGGATAIVAVSDITAVGILKVLRRHGYSVPGDVSVVAYDDTLLGRSWEPPLTSIRQGIPKAAEAAIRALVMALTHNEAPRDAMVETELVIGLTTGPRPNGPKER